MINSSEKDKKKTLIMYIESLIDLHNDINTMISTAKWYNIDFLEQVKELESHLRFSCKEKLERLIDKELEAEIVYNDNISYELRNEEVISHIIVNIHGDRASHQRRETNTHIFWSGRDINVIYDKLHQKWIDCFCETVEEPEIEIQYKRLKENEKCD